MLTPQLKKTLDVIESYMIDSGGVSPSYDEIKDVMGLSSKSAVTRLVNALCERGFLRKKHRRSRSIEVIRPSRSDSAVLIECMSKIRDDPTLTRRDTCVLIDRALAQYARQASRA